jgi:hypothetical protein
MKSDGEDGRAETRLCVQRVVAWNLRRFWVVGLVVRRLRIEVVRKRISSRISAEFGEIPNAWRMSMNWISDWRSGFSR